MKTLWITVFWMWLCFYLFAERRSAEMIRELNAPVPDWLSLAEPIKVELIDDKTLPDGYLFRPRSGGATNTRNRVRIAERKLEFEFDYEISWRGGNSEGYGVSISPDGKMLLVNSGTNPHLYEIRADSSLHEVFIKLPHVTYEEGLKGFITRWSWVGDDVMIGHSEIVDETGHEILENRIYVFYLKEQALARLDLNALNLKDSYGIEITSIGHDLKHIRMRLGGGEFTVKADLQSPPRLLAKHGLNRLQEPQSTVETPEQIESPQFEKTSPNQSPISAHLDQSRMTRDTSTTDQRPKSAASTTTSSETVSAPRTLIIATVLLLVVAGGVLLKLHCK
jgi:hypothetical protein